MYKIFVAISKSILIHCCITKIPTSFRFPHVFPNVLFLFPIQCITFHFLSCPLRLL